MTINGSTSSSEWTFKLEASETSYSVSNNTSTVKVEMYLGRARSQSYLGGNWSGSITVDGQSQSLSGNIPYPTYVNGGAWLYLGEKTYTVDHNADGSKTAGISASFSSGEFTPSSANASGNLPLTTIPRASSVTATNADISSATSININRASSSFTHTLKYSFGSLSGTIVSKTSQTSYGWTVPTTFYAQIPNAKTGTCTITCETYNGNTLIGTKTTTFTVTANETLCKPTITGSVVDSNQTTINLTGDNTKLVKYYSNAQITFSRSAKNSATITSTKINNVSVSSSPYTINGVSTNSFVITVTDSRGYSNTLTLTPTMVNYIPLTAQVSFFRTEPTTGRVSLNFSGNYFNGSFGSQNNTLTLKWYYRIKGASSWTTGGTLVRNTDYVISGNTYHSGTGSYISDIVLGSNFDYRETYEFKFEFIDKLVSKNTINNVSKGQPALWWNDDKVDIVNKLILDKYIDNTLFVDKIQSRNIFNIKGGIKTLTSTSYSISGNSITVTGIWAVYQLIDVEPNTNYHVNFTKTTENGSVGVYTSDNRTPIKTYDNIPFTFNTGNNTTVSLLFQTEGYGNTSKTATFSNIQFEKGIEFTELTENKFYGFESGENANGRWIKYADGTMICWGERTFTNINITTAWGSVYETATKNDFGTFPQAFISRPSISITPHFGVSCYIEILEGLSATNIGKTWFMCPVQRTNIASLSFNYMAIGKWR